MNDESPANAHMPARLIHQTREQIATLEGLINSARRMIDNSRTLLTELEEARSDLEQEGAYRRPEGRLA